MAVVLRPLLVVLLALVLGCSSKDGPAGSGSPAGAGQPDLGGSGGSGGGAGGSSAHAGTGGALGGGAGRSASGGGGGASGQGGSGGGLEPAGAGGVGAEQGGGAGPGTERPIVLSFTAMPATLPDGGGKTTLSFTVSGADSVSIDHGVGAVSGSSVDVDVTATTIFSLTASNASGDTHASTAVVVGQSPARSSGRYVAMISPNQGESFIAPAELRLFAAGYDINVYTNTPTDGHGGNAASLQFFVDDEPVDEQDGLSAEYWVFRGKASGVTAGQHRVWARATYTKPDLVLDSEPVLIDVVDPPSYARTVDLDADVVLSGSTGYELEGTADARIRLNGHGHRITSSDGASGPLTLRFVDAFDLGDGAAPGTSGIAVTTTGSLTIEDCTFDTSNTLSLAADGSATASIRRNVWRSNMREPIGQQPDGPSTLPVVALGGSSNATKVFAGNDIGNGAVELERTQSWLIGAEPGGSDEDGNVLIGPRVGIHVTDSKAIEVRRNYSHHVYYGGWSQGNDFELQGSPDILIEHNVIYGSSWPSRGVACEFRYNLVLEAGHEWLWPADGGRIHHNVFVGGDNDIAGIYILYEPKSVVLYNNTLDAQLGGAIAVLVDSGAVSLTSTAIVNFPQGPAVSIQGGTLSADYNAFLNPDAQDYSDGRTPDHDVTGVDPLFADPPKSEPFDLDEAGVWRRTTTTAAILALYRQRYTPKAGSPLIDAGDPAGGDGNDIGAVGAGAPNPDDQFGKP